MVIFYFTHSFYIYHLKFFCKEMCFFLPFIYSIIHKCVLYMVIKILSNQQKKIGLFNWRQEKNNNNKNSKMYGKQNI